MNKCPICKKTLPTEIKTRMNHLISCKKVNKQKRGL